MRHVLLCHFAILFLACTYFRSPPLSLSLFLHSLSVYLSVCLSLSHALSDIFATGSTETHQKRFRKFEFIREKFIQREQEARQRALFWLQVYLTHYLPYLTWTIYPFILLHSAHLLSLPVLPKDLSRLGIPIPYTSHIFEESLHQRKVLWRQEGSRQVTDELSSYDMAMPPIRHKYADMAGKMHVLVVAVVLIYFITACFSRDSTGSLSGYESESPLVSQSSFDVSMAAGVLVQLAFALPRYILMLDVWLSQVAYFIVQ